MKRVLSLSALALSAVACSAAVDKPGATLHGPGALAVFDAIVAHESGSQRPYLAIANQRGDELRLIDTTDNEVVTSPGLVFPLSIPTAGRPMLLAAADLNDTLPDALAVVSSGSDSVEFVDTWSGEPTVFASVDFAGLHDPRFPRPDPDAIPPVPLVPLGYVEVLSIVATPAPEGSGFARFVVGIRNLKGSSLVVITVQRGAGGSYSALPDPTVTVLDFAPLGLAAGTAPDVVYAATSDALGVMKITIPASGVVPPPELLGAGVPTDAVAVVRGTPDRVIAVPVGGECGASCGLLHLNPVSPLPPISVPGFVVALTAIGRDGPKTLSILSGGAAIATSGIVVASSTDGGVYLVDVDRWALVGPTLPLTGAGKTQVSAAAPVPVTGSASQLGLWPLFGDPVVPVNVSASEGELARRIRVTPGFTPDDTWTLTWQGILPGLDGLAAKLSWAPSTTPTLTVTAPAESLAALIADEAAAGDDVTISVAPAAGDTANVVAFKACLDGATLNVSALAAGVATLDLPTTCPASVVFAEVAAFTDHPAVASFQSGGLVLVGDTWGYARRVAAKTNGVPAASDEVQLPGTRLFDVADPCTAVSTCDLAWTVLPYGPTSGLDFPFPTGPALGLTPGYVDANGVSTGSSPSPGTAITFTTKSGLVVPYARRPVDDGTALSSALPTGLAFLPFDPGVDSAVVSLFAGYTAGLVMNFGTASAPSSMSIIR